MARGGGSVLGVSTLDFHADFDTIIKFNISTITREDINKHKNLRPFSKEWERSSKNIIAKWMAHYGYNEYKELDINDRADILWDLNYPIPEKYVEKYDFAIDSAVKYVSNMPQALINVMNMIKPGGALTITGPLGDISGRFPLSPSIEFLHDFLNLNGFEVKDMLVYKYVGHNGIFLKKYPKDLFNRKISYLYNVISWEEYVDYSLSMLAKVSKLNNNNNFWSEMGAFGKKYENITSHPTYVVHFIAVKLKKTPEKPRYPQKAFYKDRYIFKEGG